MKIAIYPLSADPITYGHLNIIKRARRVFDEVIVAIGVNESKNPAFTLKKRTEMAEKAIAHLYGNDFLSLYSGIRVVSFQGMLVDFAYQQNVHTIIRGARSAADFDYERLLSDVNYYQGLGIDTYVLFTEPRLSHISSSAAKAIVKNSGKDILSYVPLFIKKEMERVLLDQRRIGITGGIAAGKNYVSKLLTDLPDIRCHEIDTDTIGHFILEESKEPRDYAVREKLVHQFGNKTLNTNGFVNMPKLRGKIFEDASSRTLFDSIVREAMYHEIRQRLLTLKGIMLINCAILIESDLMDLVNNNVILVNASRAIQIKRMKARKYSGVEIIRRLRAQWSTTKKIQVANKKISEDRTGRLILHRNGDRRASQDPIQDLYNRIIEAVGDK